MSKQPSGTSDLQAIRRKRDMRRKTIPALAQAGPVSIWMILFVTLPMLFIIYISFMSRGVFGDVVYQFSLESYQTLLDATYFKVILKSLKAALLTTVLCLGLGYPFAYYIARKPPEVASRLIMLIMIPFWTNSLMRLNSWLLLFQTSGPVTTFSSGPVSSTAPSPSSIQTGWWSWGLSPTCSPSRCSLSTAPLRSFRSPFWRPVPIWGPRRRRPFSR